MAPSAAETGRFAQEWLFKQEWNFDNSPRTGDIDTYARALLVCAKGDGVISLRERDWVLGYYAAFAGHPEGLARLAVYPGDDDIVDLVTRSAVVNGSRGALVFDALRACDADGDLAPGEVARIKRAATALGVDEDTVDRLKELYLQEKAARTARNALLYPDGSPL
ncbi:TerB family tellurite resistance protein [Streptomyces sp. JNUCC 64]